MFSAIGNAFLKRGKQWATRNFCTTFKGRVVQQARRKIQLLLDWLDISRFRFSNKNRILWGEIPSQLGGGGGWRRQRRFLKSFYLLYYCEVCIYSVLRRHTTQELQQNSVNNAETSPLASYAVFSTKPESAVVVSREENASVPRKSWRAANHLFNWPQFSRRKGQESLQRGRVLSGRV